MRQIRKLLGILVTLGAQSLGLSAASAQDAIVFQPSAPVLEYTASKTMVCGDIQWRVTWRSRTERPRMSGEIVVLLGGQGYFLNDAQSEVFERFSSVDNVSATCMPGDDENPTRSHLLVLGYELGTGSEALAQVSIEPDGEATWSFDAD